MAETRRGQISSFNTKPARGDIIIPFGKGCRDEEAPFFGRGWIGVTWWSWRRLDRHPYIIPQKQRNLDGGRE